MKTERNTASQFCGTRFSGSPEDTLIPAEVGEEKPGDRGLPGVSTQWVRPGSPQTHTRQETKGPFGQSESTYCVERPLRSFLRRRVCTYCVPGPHPPNIPYAPTTWHRDVGGLSARDRQSPLAVHGGREIGQEAAEGPRTPEKGQRPQIHPCSSKARSPARAPLGCSPGREDLGAPGDWVSPASVLPP